MNPESCSLVALLTAFAALYAYTTYRVAMPPHATNKYPASVVAPVPRQVWAMWFGDAPTGPRLEAMKSIEAVGVPVVWLNDTNWKQVEKPTWLFPPALLLDGLSKIHRADYLRAYVMHHYGGGYTDIKPTIRSWAESFDEFADASVWVVGVSELGRESVACYGNLWFLDVPTTCNQVKNAWRSLASNCAYIMRPYTPLTATWLREATRRLELRENEIRAHPAHRQRCCHPSDNPNGYTPRWAEFHGEILHPLMAVFRKHVRTSLPMWRLAAYRGSE